MISQAWRVSAQTSRWSAHGKPSGTWSSATWRNMELFSPPLCLYPSCHYSTPCGPNIDWQANNLLHSCCTDEATFDVVDVWPGYKRGAPMHFICPLPFYTLFFILYSSLPPLFLPLLIPSSFSTKGKETDRIFSVYFLTKKGTLICVTVIPQELNNLLLFHPFSSRLLIQQAHIFVVVQPNFMLVFHQ